ncbi:MAG: alpha/beta hydrolase [Rhodospirillum sp.]|nr:alpha/beta hydrolase [Rhodospirillum sp.]MCF8490130.1 alpha/beta hydrolase [Rhodospirillum sp.]MCF8501974.1 alpha/beta hydrolase [Rhodospirillum sp.]
MSTAPDHNPIRSARTLLSTLPERRIVEVDGQPISYRSAGSGPPILFLHGLLGCADSWVWQFLDLTGHHRVIAWDAPGYGDSAPAAPDLEAFTDRLCGFIATVSPGPLTLVGHSMGGTLAARLAADPGSNLSCLVLSCTHAGYAAPPDRPPTEKLLERIRDLREGGGEAYGRSRAKAMVAMPATPFVLDLAARVAAGTRPDGLFTATRMLQFANVRPFYARIPCPTRVLFGERDPVVRPDLSAELRDLTPFATHVVLPNVGHAPYLEDPKAYEAALAPFLAGPATDTKNR